MRLVHIFLSMAGAVFAADEYTAEVLVPGHGFQGIHGLIFGADDQIYVGSVIGQSIYKVNPETGDAEAYQGPPQGMADDVEFGPDGALYWTAFTIGQVFRRDNGEVKQLASGLPGMNSLAFKQDGRLFATQVFLGDALYEIDPEGEDAPRKIMADMGGLNGFDFGPDGKLYGPLWFKGQVARVDVDKAELEVVAEGFETPAAANFDSQGRFWVLDTKAGKIIQLDSKTGERLKTFDFRPGMDNLAFDSQDRLFVTVMMNNAIFEIDTVSGEAREVKSSNLAVPSDIALTSAHGRDTLYVADIFALRSVDTSVGAVRDLALNYVDELELPIGIYADNDRILAISWFSGTVQELDPASGASRQMLHGFAAPMDAVALPNGDWIVVEAGGRLVRVAADDRSKRTTAAEGLGGAVALALANENTLYVTLGARGAIARVDVETGKVEEVATGLANPEGIAMDVDGTLVVAEVGKQRVIRVTPDSGEVTALAAELPMGLPAPPGLPPTYVPTGVAVGSDGAIYVTSDLESALYKLTPAN